MKREAVPLREVLEVQNGFAFKTEFFDDSNGFPLIRIRDLGSCTTEANYVGDYRDEFLVEPGELLIGMDGSFRCRRWAGPRALLNQRVCRLRNFSPRLLAEYVYYAIQPQLDAIESKTSFATVKHISAKQILEIEIPLPSIEEQRRLVDLLARAEGIVRLRREAQQKAAELIPAIFIDMFGDPATNPKRWPVEVLGALSEVQGGLQVSASRSGLPLTRPYLRVANVYRCRLDLAEVKTIDLTAAEFNRTRLQQGDLLVVEGHGNPEEVGRVAVWDGSVEECTHQNHLIRARPLRDRLLPHYACALLNSASGRQSLRRAGKTTSGLSTISARNVKEASVMLPPVAMQAEFERDVEAVGAIERQQAAALDKARAAFDALLAKAF